MSRWFRHYAGMMRDDKLVRAALRAKQPVERVVWVYGAILESAAELDDDGRYEIDHAEIAYFLRADEGDIARIEVALGDLERVYEGHVAKWSSRQFQSDRSAERTKRYRDRNKSSGDGAENVPVTISDGAVTTIDCRGDAPETETETETERKKVSRALEKEFEDEFWPAWPNKVGRPAALKSFLRARKTHELPVIMAGLRFYATNKPPDREWLNPATFLNQERFMDQPAARSAVPAGASKSPIVDRQAGKTWCSDSSELYRAWEAYRPKYVKMMTEERGDDRGAWLPPLPHDCSLGINREGNGV